MTMPQIHELKFLGNVISVDDETIIVYKDDPEKITAIIDGHIYYRFRVGSIINVVVIPSRDPSLYKIISETESRFKAIKFSVGSNAVVRSEVYLNV